MKSQKSTTVRSFFARYARRMLSLTASLVLLLSILVPAGFLALADGAVPEPADTVPGNRMVDPEFNTGDFADSYAYGKWYPAPGSGASLSLVSGSAQAGDSSLKITDRTAFWHRADYRLWFGELEYGKTYTFQIFAGAAAATTLELYIEAIAWGGPAGNEYPIASMKMDSAAVTPDAWQRLSGTFSTMSVPSATEGKMDVTITWAGGSQTLTAVSGLDCIQFFVQEPYSESTDCPDLYLDSAVFKAGETLHANGENTETGEGNLIVNAGFETNDFAAGHTFNQWYNISPATITQNTAYSQSGQSSLQISGRTDHWHSAQYRVWFGSMTAGTLYDLSSYVSAARETGVELDATVWGYGGPAGNEYPSVSMTLASGTANAEGWTNLEGTFRITLEDAGDGKVNATVTWGDQTGKIENVSGVDCVEIYVRQPYGAEEFPDLYLDSFLLKAVSEEEPPVTEPTGHANGENTEEIDGNLIVNAGFETNDFAAGHTFNQWYNISPATITQNTAYSQSGQSSLQISGRTDHWHSAQYRVWFGSMTAGTLYDLSSYVSAARETGVELDATVWGYGGPAGNEYPSVSMTLASGTANAEGWTDLEGTFRITLEDAGDGKVNATVTWGDQTGKIENVSGVDCVEIYVRQPYGAEEFPDLYLDSFLLKAVSEEEPPVTEPTGHANGENTEEIDGNLIANAGFERDDFTVGHNFGQWYKMPDCPAALTQIDTYSQSGGHSLKVSGRTAFWHCAQQRVWFGNMSYGTTYDLSGYVSASKKTNVELTVVVWGYGGPDGDPYPSVMMKLATGVAGPDGWTCLSGNFLLTSEKAGDGKITATVTWGENVGKVENVTGVDNIELYIRQPAGVTEFPDLYYDSFLLKATGEEDPNAVAEGHTNAEYNPNDPRNLIVNGGAEISDFVLQDYAFGKWYTMFGCPATLTRDTAYSHSGKASLKVSDRDLFWHRAEYRVEGGNIVIGHPYEIKGYVSSASNTNVEMLLQIYGYGGPENDPYPNFWFTAASGTTGPGKWTELSVTLTITAKKNAEEGFYDYTVTVEGTEEPYKLNHVRGISGIQIMPQEAYSSFSPRTDLYLDSFSMRDIAPSAANLKAPTGHAEAANTEDLENNMINNAGFEAALFTDVMNFGMWFTNGSGYRVEQVDTYSHSGDHSVRIFERKAANNTLIYRIEASGIRLDTQYTLSGYVAALQNTHAKLILTIYGYDGPVDKRTYPYNTVVLDQHDVKDWTEFGGSFVLHYRNGCLYLESGGKTTAIGKCIALSGVEFYVITDETAAHYDTDLYLDSFALTTGASATPVGVPDVPVEEDVILLLKDNEQDVAGAAGRNYKKQEAAIPGNAGTAADMGSALYTWMTVVGGVLIAGSVAVIVYSLRRDRKRRREVSQK